MTLMIVIAVPDRCDGQHINSCSDTLLTEHSAVSSDRHRLDTLPASMLQRDRDVITQLVNKTFSYIPTAIHNGAVVDRQIA